MQEWIGLKGLKQNNLKNISLKLPRNKFIVVTGVSGSGKSSLAFDVINNEGRRKYFINLSGQARKYLSKLEKPDAERISGLTPTIAVSQGNNNSNPRSTVGTISEIYDFLRLLFARLGNSENKALEINRSLFSFNSPSGACPQCNGLGIEDKIDPELLIEDARKSIRDRAFKITNPHGYIIYSQVTIDALNQVCNAHGFDVDIPWKDLTPEQQNIVLNGSEKIKIPYGKHTLESRMKWAGITAKPREEGFYKGILPVMNDILKRDRNPNILRFARSFTCTSCNGTRLSADALSVKINNFSIDDLARLGLSDLAKQLQKLRFSKQEQKIADEIISPILERIQLLSDLGLGYLSCSRPANTLSGGEIQRMRLAKQIASNLRNITFVFDEPSAGVHPKVNQQIIHKLKTLAQNQNTVIAVEHDKDTILQADWIVEVGPLAGTQGGEIRFNGPLEDFLNATHDSFTLDYLNHKSQLHLPFSPKGDEATFDVKHACINNLKNIDVSFKHNQLNVITGISGAGKSSLVFQTLIPLAKGNYYKQLNACGNPQLQNFDFDQTLYVDQSPIGKTARSTPATYTKIFDGIRQLYAKLPQSKAKKYTQSTFSYNTPGGRCEHCEGAGKIETGMHFLGNIERVCEQCQGKRYTNEINQITYKGKGIADVLSLNFEQAFAFFQDEPNLAKQLKLVNDIGLGYLQLGQSSNTLSGGEAQRIKLATELIKGNGKNTLFVFNEPTNGLHFHDIQVLLNLFAKLLKQGHTVLVIEHHPDFIRQAHHLIDLGHGAGNMGGKLVFSGSFSSLLKSKASITAQSFQQKATNTIGKQPTNKLQQIEFKGVRTHNLKGIDFAIPSNQITAVVGVSGSGKTSLAFDTLFAESQNRFTESFPNYVRQFSSHYSQANFQQVNGLTPVIGIRQKNQINDPRSTLATFVDIYDMYRVLYSRFGKTSIASKPKLTASHFSFNQPEGSCPVCSGLGNILSSKASLLFQDAQKSFFDGAFHPHKSLQFYADPNGQYLATLSKVGEKYGYNYQLPIEQLKKEAIKKALFGTGEEMYDVVWEYKRKNRTGTHHFSGKWEGFAQLIIDEYYRKHANGKGQDLLPYLYEKKCPQCHGMRLNQQALSVRFSGLNIAQLTALSVKESLVFFKKAKEHSKSKEIDIQLLEIIIDKLSALNKLGLDYLTLNRKTSTLSGGEYQRTLLSTQLTGGLSGITYILDEPSTGLHPADIHILTETIRTLKNLGNTIVFTDHQPELINHADYIIELGPGAGKEGGEIVFSGKRINTPDINVYTKPKQNKPLIPSNLHHFISIKKATANNLKSIDVKLALNQLNVVCGVSGSGKTSLLKNVLFNSLATKQLNHCENITGIPDESAIQWISTQKNTATQTTLANFFDLFSAIRKVFAALPSAKQANLKATDFSNLSKGSQCPACKGHGEISVKLDFINDVHTVCESCNGTGYKKHILEITLNEKNIAQALDLTIEEALTFFNAFHSIQNKLNLIKQSGLAYLRLNQKLSQLSNGELQRAKIVQGIINSTTENTIFLFDEPSKGLHPKDLHYLFSLFKTLLKNNCTLIIIEHNPQLIAVANWIIELGKGAGKDGGTSCFEGTFSDLQKANTKTALYFAQSTT